MKTGSCPKCKKEHSQLSFNNQASKKIPAATHLINNEHTEIPKWIKVFGWLFIVFAIATPLIPFILKVLGQPTASYGIFGLSYHGSPFSPMALLISSIFIALGVSAFGLLFNKSWGINACLAMAYISAAICIFSMVYPLINRIPSSNIALNFRLELILLIPYIKWLHKVKLG